MPSAPRYDIHEYLPQMKVPETCYASLAAWTSEVGDWAVGKDKQRLRLLAPELAAFDVFNLCLEAGSGFCELLRDGNGLNSFFRGHRGLETIGYEPGVRATAPVAALLQRLGIPENGSREDYSLFDLPAKNKWRRLLRDEAGQVHAANPGHPYDIRLEVVGDEGSDDDDMIASQRLYLVTAAAKEAWLKVENGIYPAIVAHLEAHVAQLESRKK